MRSLKPIALFLILLTLLSALLLTLSACGGTGAPSGGGNGGSPSGPSDTPSGDNLRPKETDKEGNQILGAPVSETEAETDPPEVVPLLKVVVGEASLAPSVYYEWEGDRGDGKGTDARLPLLSALLPIISGGEELVLIPKDGATVSYVRAFDASLKETALEGEGADALRALPTGLWSVIVGVTWDDEGAPYGAELAFRLSIGVRLFVKDGTDVTVPTEFAASRTTYDEATDAWQTEIGEGASISSVAASLPELTLSEDLFLEMLGGIESLYITLYDAQYEPVGVTVSSLDEIRGAVNLGTWYAVISVEWTGEYITAYERYETETCEYALRLLIP